MAQGVEVARAFVTVIPSAKGAEKNLTAAIAPAAGSAGKAGGAAAAAGLGAALKKFVLPAAVVGAIALIGKKGLDAFAEVEKGANNVIKATGATGEKAKELTGVYKDVARSVVGDFDDIGSAVGEINTRLGLNGKELETASEAMMKYAKVTGQDATAATKDVASMMRNAGIPTAELESTLGKLTVAGQAAGIDVSKLAKNTTKYNAVMKQLGLSTDEQIALMAKFEQSGADTSSILNAMKRGVASWAKEGKDAKTEFANFVQGVQDGTVTAGDAVEIFGSRGGLSMYEAAQKGQLSFEDMFETISKASGKNLDQVYKDTLTNSERMELAFNNIKLAAADVFAPLAEGISAVLDTIVLPALQAMSKAMDEFAASPAGQAVAASLDAIWQAVQRLWTVFQQAGGEIMAQIQANAPQLQVIFDAVVHIITTIADLASALIPPIAQVFSIVFDTVVQVVSAALPVIDDILGQFVAFVRTTLIPIINAILQVARPIISTIVQIVTAAMPIIQRVVGAAINFIKGAFNGIKVIATVVRNVFNSVKAAIQNPLAAARDFVAGIVDKIKSFFSFEIKLPHIDLPHIHYDLIEVPLLGQIPDPLTFSIDWYAKGGIFTKPTIAGIGEAGAEAVIPLDRMDEMRGDSRVVELLEQILAKDENIYLDGRELANSTVGHTDRALGARQVAANRGIAQ